MATVLMQLLIRHTFTSYKPLVHTHVQVVDMDVHACALECLRAPCPAPE